METTLMSNIAAFTYGENWSDLIAHFVDPSNLPRDILLRSSYPIWTGWEKLAHRNINELSILALYYLDCKEIGKKRPFIAKEEQAIRDIGQSITDLGVESAGFILAMSAANISPLPLLDIIGTNSVLYAKETLTKGILGYATQLGKFIRTTVTYGFEKAIEMAEQPEPISKMGSVVIGVATLMTAMPLVAVKVATDVLSQPRSQVELAYWLGYLAFRRFVNEHKDADLAMRAIRLNIAKSTVESLNKGSSTNSGLDTQAMVSELQELAASLPPENRTADEDTLIRWVAMNKLID